MTTAYSLINITTAEIQLSALFYRSKDKNVAFSFPYKVLSAPPTF